MTTIKREEYNNVFMNWAIDYTQNYLRLEFGNDLSLKYEYIASQLIFFRDYVNYMFIDGTSIKTIEAFLEKQSVTRDKSRYALKLDGGNTMPVFIEIDDIKEFDFIDSKNLTYYRRVTIYNKDNQPWSKESASVIIEQIKENMEWNDGDKAFIKPKIIKHILMLDVRVKDGFDDRFISEL